MKKINKSGGIARENGLGINRVETAVTLAPGFPPALVYNSPPRSRFQRVFIADADR